MFRCDCITRGGGGGGRKGVIGRSLYMSFSNFAFLLQTTNNAIHSHTKVSFIFHYILAVDSAVCRCDRRAVSITPLDTPLMCPYTTHHPGTVFPTQLQPLRLPIQGIMYNIYNNIWDTNYVLWYPYQEDDQTFKARYHVSLELY